MSAYTIEGRGRIKAEPFAVTRGTAQTQPEYVERTKIEVVVKDHQVEQLVSNLTDRLGSEGEKYLIFPLP
jgi:nitrogen regulatory protein P-II 1